MYLDAFGLAGDEHRTAGARRDRLRDRPDDECVHQALLVRVRLRSRLRIPRALPRGGRPVRSCRPAAHDPRARRAHARRPRRRRRPDVQLHHAAALLAQRCPQPRRRVAARAAPRAGRIALNFRQRVWADVALLPLGKVVRAVFAVPGLGPWLSKHRTFTRLAWQVNRLDPAPCPRTDPRQGGRRRDLAQPTTVGADLGRRRRRTAVPRRDQSGALVARRQTPLSDGTGIRYAPLTNAGHNLAPCASELSGQRVRSGRSCGGCSPSGPFRSTSCATSRQPGRPARPCRGPTARSPSRTQLSLIPQASTSPCSPPAPRRRASSRRDSLPQE